MLKIKIKVVPGSREHRWLIKNDTLTCYLTSRAERGLANAELIKSLAKKLGLTQCEVTIVAGETACYKTVALATTMSYQELCARLGIEVQHALF